MNAPVFKMPPQKRMPPIWFLKAMTRFGHAKKWSSVDIANGITVKIGGYYFRGTTYITEEKIEVDHSWRPNTGYREDTSLPNFIAALKP